MQGLTLPVINLYVIICILYLKELRSSQCWTLSFCLSGNLVSLSLLYVYVCCGCYLGCVSPVNSPDIVSPEAAGIVRLACRPCRSRSCLTTVLSHSGDMVVSAIIHLV